MHSSARFSKRTAERWSTCLVLSPLDEFLRLASILSRSATIVAVRFQALFTSLWRILFSFPSRYYYAIGPGEYLALEVDASQIHARYPTHATLFGHGSAVHVYGAFTLFGAPFQETSTYPLGPEVAEPHLLQLSRKDSVWAGPCSLAVNNGVPVGFSSCPY